MATLIAAVSAYRPRILSARTVGLDAFTASLTRGSLVNLAIARTVFADMCEEMRNALLRGAALQLPGIDRTVNAVRVDGGMRPTVHVDSTPRGTLANPGAIEGAIDQRANNGPRTAATVALPCEALLVNPIEPAFDVDPAA